MDQEDERFISVDQPLVVTEGLSVAILNAKFFRAVVGVKANLTLRLTPLVHLYGTVSPTLPYLDPRSGGTFKQFQLLTPPRPSLYPPPLLSYLSLGTTSSSSVLILQH